MTRQTGFAGFRGGYLTVSELVNSVFNVTASLALIICASPLFVLVALLILVHDGRPILYTGRRLGKDKKPFTMYKFRTLVPDAERIIGPEVLATKHKAVTPIGKFLRPTRLDELPQLFNVLRRDMDLFGPRPQRQEIYDAICRNIKSYDRRFLVKPGLIGYPQLFLPHNAPKRLQSIVDNKFLWKNKEVGWEILIIFYTIGVVVRKVFQKSLRYLRQDLVQGVLLRRYKEKRDVERLPAANAAVLLPGDAPSGAAPERAVLVDINERAFLMQSGRTLDGEEFICELVIDVRRPNGQLKHKSARCRARRFRSVPSPESRGEYRHVVEYTPVSPFNFYLVNQYFLKGSMVA